MSCDWCVNTERQPNRRCIAPMSMLVRRNKTPSSVVRGVESNSWRKTWNGKVCREPATGELKISPKDKTHSELIYFYSRVPKKAILSTITEAIFYVQFRWSKANKPYVKLPSFSIKLDERFIRNDERTEGIKYTILALTSQKENHAARSNVV
jgi:hypothetical protein